MQIVPTGISFCINGTCSVVGWPWVIAMGVILVMIIALCFVKPR